MIVVDNLSKSYGKQGLFDAISFKVNRKERVGVVGRNGHGKTTLFRMIIGEEEPDEGTITKPRKYRIGYVEQRVRFMEPTVLTDVPVDVPLFKEETFGPVAPLVRFTSVEDAIRMANDSPYGLQSAVFTQDINKALDIAYRLEAGGVIVNWSSALRVETLPFGGVKMSGHGREGVHDTLDEMTDQKTIIVHNAFPAAE